MGCSCLLFLSFLCGALHAFVGSLAVSLPFLLVALDCRFCEIDNLPLNFCEVVFPAHEQHCRRVFGECQRAFGDFFGKPRDCSFRFPGEKPRDFSRDGFAPSASRFLMRLTLAVALISAGNFAL